LVEYHTNGAADTSVAMAMGSVALGTQLASGSGPFEETERLWMTRTIIVMRRNEF
jgi:hypothetical protein